MVGCRVVSCSHSLNLSAGRWLDRQYALDETGVWVRGGAVLATLPVGLAASGIGGSEWLGGAQRNYTHLVLTVYPGAAVGSTVVYEDDGITTAYQAFDTGAEAWTNASYTRNASRFRMTVRSRTRWHGQRARVLPARRTYVVRLLHCWPPKAVVVDGTPALPVGATRGGRTSAWAARGATWSYDGATATLEVAAEVSTYRTLTMEVEADTLDASGRLSGLAGMLRRANLAKRNLVR